MTQKLKDNRVGPSHGIDNTCAEASYQNIEVWFNAKEKRE
jgi:hypothetical protein